MYFMFYRIKMQTKQPLILLLLGFQIKALKFNKALMSNHLINVKFHKNINFSFWKITIKTGFGWCLVYYEIFVNVLDLTM